MRMNTAGMGRVAPGSSQLPWRPRQSAGEPPPGFPDPFISRRRLGFTGRPDDRHRDDPLSTPPLPPPSLCPPQPPKKRRIGLAIESRSVLADRKRSGMLSV